MKIINRFVKEDIIDEKGNKIGEIKFNPNDSTIMKTLADILSNLNGAVKELDKYKNIDLTKLSKNSTLEEFEKAGEEIEKITTSHNNKENMLQLVDKFLNTEKITRNDILQLIDKIEIGAHIEHLKIFFKFSI